MALLLLLYENENFFIPRVEEISIPEKRLIRNSYIFKTSHVIEFVNCDCTYLTILVTANFCSLFCSILLSLLSWFSSFGLHLPIQDCVRCIQQSQNIRVTRRIVLPLFTKAFCEFGCFKEILQKAKFALLHAILLSCPDTILHGHNSTLLYLKKYSYY